MTKKSPSKPPRTQTRTIVVEIDGRLRQVRATVLGLLGAHRTVAPVKKGYNVPRWSITHLPSGRRVTDISPSRSKAIELLKALQGFSWGFYEAEDVKHGVVIQIWAITRQLEQTTEENEAIMSRLSEDYQRASRNLADAAADVLRRTPPGTEPDPELKEALRLFRREELFLINTRAIEATTEKSE
jgi:hypothetical protein